MDLKMVLLILLKILKCNKVEIFSILKNFLVYINLLKVRRYMLLYVLDVVFLMLCLECWNRGGVFKLFVWSIFVMFI